MPIKRAGDSPKRRTPLTSYRNRRAARYQTGCGTHHGASDARKARGRSSRQADHSTGSYNTTSRTSDAEKPCEAVDLVCGAMLPVTLMIVLPVPFAHVLISCSIVDNSFSTLLKIFTNRMLSHPFS